MAYKPQIRYNPQMSSEDNWKAMINWVNFLLREMSVGRVPQNRKDTQKVQLRQREQDVELAQADENAIALFEEQMAQNEIIAAQDDTLIELYEMFGGE